MIEAIAAKIDLATAISSLTRQGILVEIRFHSPFEDEELFSGELKINGTHVSVFDSETQLIQQLVLLAIEYQREEVEYG